jgi:hypothetical protein
MGHRCFRGGGELARARGAAVAAAVIGGSMAAAVARLRCTEEVDEGSWAGLGRKGSWAGADLWAVMRIMAKGISG